MEAILFPDAVAVSRDYLADALVATGDLVTEVGGRTTNAERFVVLELTDAETHRIVMQRSTIRVDCYSDTTLGKQEAHDLGQLCRGLLGAMQGTQQADTTVYRVADGVPGLNNSPDEISGKARFSFHVVVTLRGAALSV